jgi:hypothetical protein
MSALNELNVTPQCSTCAVFVIFTDELFLSCETICSTLTGLWDGEEELGYHALLILLDCCALNWWRGMHNQIFNIHYISLRYVIWKADHIISNMIYERKGDKDFNMGNNVISPSFIQIFFSVPCSQIPTVYILPLMSGQSFSPIQN